MAKVKYSKYDVYDFIERKEREVKIEKTKELEAKRDELKQKYLKEKFANIDIDAVMKAVSDFNDAIKDATFDFGTYSSKIYDTFTNTQNMIDSIKNKGLTAEEFFLKDVSRTVDFDYAADFQQTCDNITTLRGDISKEFRKIMAMAQAAKNGAQVVKQLQQLGFDTSSIKPMSDGNEVLVLEVDNVLLGLPEENSQLAENSQF